jgi:hypothetical protein
MITRFYKRLTRTKFEDIVLSRYQNVSKRLHKEETFESKIVNLTLYYNKGVHIGTWHSKGAWLDVA